MKKLPVEKQSYCQNIDCENRMDLHEKNTMIKYDGLIFCTIICCDLWKKENHYRMPTEALIEINKRNKR